jgi:tRNA-splicing ligase RtcB
LELSMKVQRLIAPWKGNKQFTAISKRAAALKKQGHAAEQIIDLLTEEFGAPHPRTPLRDTAQPLRIYGDVGTDIDAAAVAQIELALRLPVAVAGALLPDAHPGYALPIGGVFAAHRAVAPAMVGVDIGCRMHLSLLDLPPDDLLQQRDALFADLQAVTLFGNNVRSRRTPDHAILDDPRWQSTGLLRHLHRKAQEHLGSSGSGNHFAELVIGERLSPESDLPATFTGLLTHSGSRGVGFAIANHYIRLAEQETARVAQVPKLYTWLDLDHEAGQEYWQAMELAGDFAQANHEVIHAQFARRARVRPLTVIQNHHNFAWQQGDLVLHRKGATPAAAGVLGVIPGSMASAAYIVRGLGAEGSLASAAHGAGRVGSRTEATQTIAISDVRALLRERDVLVAGLSVDESPLAYKDIERVMSIQVAAGLVTPLARMHPVAVIMAGASGAN